MSKYELLAPAGDLEKLKIAVLYGADAVFIGGLKFSLRSRASNFTIDDIKKGCEFAHKNGAKIHVTCNIVMHEKDIDGIVEYLKALEGAGVDCIIASSISILKLVKAHTKMEAHVSTQDSIINQEAIEVFESIGVDRVVLARELSLEEIEVIIDTGGIPFSPRVKSDDGKEYLDCPRVVTDLVYTKAEDWYGNPLPYLIEQRYIYC